MNKAFSFDDDDKPTRRSYATARSPWALWLPVFSATLAALLVFFFLLLAAGGYIMKRAIDEQKRRVHTLDKVEVRTSHV